MGKLVVLRLGEGSFEEGFPVTLQMGEDGKNPSLEIQGKLPSTPEIPQYYSGWATTYRRLGLRSRLEASSKPVINVSKLESCSNAADVLRDHLNQWLCSESFRPIREKLLEQLMPSDEVRIIIQTENSWLRRLPWHLWELCDRYPKAEIALSAPVYERVEQITLPHVKVRILAILGNSTGINTQADRLLLEQLPDAEIKFLVEPERQELTEELWNHGWDILFFAGHSSSQGNGETGRIYLNQTDSLTIDQLKYALKKAVERGLKIAIFNSCDGLGLARNLADLQIPQIIIMREPVPDRVSQEFLKYFLQAFAQGESFYLAVREAREKLQGLEDKFPCATWLPMICQNPAVLPPTWQELGGRLINTVTATSPTSNPPNPSRKRLIWSGRPGLGRAVLMSLVSTSLVMVIRQLGMLQPLELKAFDYLMRSRPAEPPDSRLLVVKITEEDIQAQQPELKGIKPERSLSDRSLARLLEILESYQPQAVGLDIFRDFPAKAEYKDLARRMQHSDRLFVVCQVSSPETNDPGIAPPPEIPLERQGFSDVVVDPDGVVRRHLLAMDPPAASACTPSYALSTQLALHYLAAKGISPKFTPDHHLQLGTTSFKRLEAHAGGYQTADTWGRQVLLNYRSYRSPENFVEQVTLSALLNGKVNPNAVKNRIVLIGVTAPSRKDYFATPYSMNPKLAKDLPGEMPGVVLQTQMVSQMISAVLDHRPLLSVWPIWGEALWIWGWSLLGGLLSWRFQVLLRWGLVGGTLFILYSLCFGLLIQGYWVPLIPSSLALVSTVGGVLLYGVVQTQRQQSTFALKS